MPKSIIVQGKTTAEAISNGLKELNVSKDRVDIKVLEEHEKRSFFSILAPRVVKVELTRKESSTEQKHFKEKVFNTIIPRLIKLAEAPSHGKPILEYAPESRGAEAYINLAKEVIERNGQ